MRFLPAPEILRCAFSSLSFSNVVKNPEEKASSRMNVVRGGYDSRQQIGEVLLNLSTPPNGGVLLYSLPPGGRWHGVSCDGRRVRNFKVRLILL